MVRNLGASEFDFYDIPGLDTGTGNTFETPAPGAAPSILEADYYRGKVAEFQRYLVGADRAARSLRELIDDPLIAESAKPALIAHLYDYESRASWLRGAATAINAAISTANYLGAEIPRVNVPVTLGALPFAIPGVWVAALATGAAATLFISQWIEGAKQRILEAQRTAGLTPEMRQELELKRVEIARIEAETNVSPFGAIASSVKWIALGVGAYLAYRAYVTYKDR